MMDNTQIKSLEELLNEARANDELTKLAEETSVDSVDEVKIPEGTEDKKPEESTPEVKEDEVIKTADESEDVKPIDNKDLQEEAEGVVLPEGTEDKEPEESAPEVKAEDVVETADEAEDVKPLDNEDLKEEAEGVVLPEGTLERKPEEDVPEVKEDEVIETVDSAEDVKPLDNEDLQEEAEGAVIPEGTEDRKPEEDVPEVKEDDVIETVDSAEDVKPIENEDLKEETDGVVLPEGTEDKKPEESAPEVKEDEVIKTADESEDVEALDNDALTEAIDKLNEEIIALREADEVVIPEGTEDKKPEESKPDIKLDDIIKTIDSAEDVKADEVEGKMPESKEYHAACAVEATGGEDSPLADKCCEKCDCKKSYSSLKEAISLGSEYFNTDEKINTLKEQVSVLLAKENNDLLYDELVRAESSAKILRETIEKKYSIISNNRVENLFESMKAAEQKIAARKNDMFKKLAEQQEVNKALSEAELNKLDEATVVFNESKDERECDYCGRKMVKDDDGHWVCDTPDCINNPEHRKEVEEEAPDYDKMD